MLFAFLMLRQGFSCCDKLLLAGLSLCRDILRLGHDISAFSLPRALLNLCRDHKMNVVTYIQPLALSIVATLL